MKENKANLWPYAIAIGIALVFVAGITTVVVANKVPVEKSDEYMMSYQEADAKANDLIQARIAFDKKYKIAYITDGLSLDNTTLKYKVTDIDGNPVNDANIFVAVTRPDIHQYDKNLENPSVENGVYSFSSVTLPKEGRWNFIAKITVGDDSRFYNIKADTRKKEASEY